MTANESMDALKAAREAKAGKGWLGSWRSGKDSKDTEAKAEARAEAKAAKDAKKAEKQAAKAKAANLHSSSPPGHTSSASLVWPAPCWFLQPSSHPLDIFEHMK